MENWVNLQSYQNVESVQFGMPVEEFRQYCDLKLLSAESDRDFIKKNVYCGELLNVCEIGCGNGKLLLSLERENMISHANGYEVSENRCRFSNKFLDLYKSKRVDIINKNFLEDDSPCGGGYDLIILVDIVFQLISPLYDEAEHDALQWLYGRLNKGGMLYFELEDYSAKLQNILKKGADLFWEEFPPEDPFQYGLYKLDVDEDGNIVDDKKFILRNTNTEESFRNIIKSYTRDESIKLLTKYGFDPMVYPYFEERNRTTASGEHDLYRILAKKL